MRADPAYLRKLFRDGQQYAYCVSAPMQPGRSTRIDQNAQRSVYTVSWQVCYHAISVDMMGVAHAYWNLKPVSASLSRCGDLTTGAPYEPSCGRMSSLGGVAQNSSAGWCTLTKALPDSVPHNLIKILTRRTPSGRERLAASARRSHWYVQCIMHSRGRLHRGALRGRRPGRTRARRGFNAANCVPRRARAHARASRRGPPGRGKLAAGRWNTHI